MSRRLSASSLSLVIRLVPEVPVIDRVEQDPVFVGDDDQGSATPGSWR